MYLGAITLLSVFSEPAKTSVYIGFIGLSWGAGTVIGPLIGGALESSSAGWRWVNENMLETGQNTKSTNIFFLGLLYQSYHRRGFYSDPTRFDTKFSSPPTRHVRGTGITQYRLAGFRPKLAGICFYNHGY